MGAVTIEVRDYRPDDAEAWLRCRVLSFLHTAYYDAVEPVHPGCEAPGFGLVAVEEGDIVGLFDVSVSGQLATIDTVAVHPDAQRRGIGTALLAAGRERALLAGATMSDTWTRDDEPTLRWYRSRGFVESGHYLHVYANHYTDPADLRRAITSAAPWITPIIAFFHAEIDAEPELRQRFARVHVCRRFSQSLL